jgi:hypothetical protein
MSGYLQRMWEHSDPSLTYGRLSPPTVDERGVRIRRREKSSSGSRQALPDFVQFA